MVASLIGAATNGVGFEGLYPLATIRSWDAAPRGPQLDSAEVAAGILAAARAGRSVINLSLGGPKDLALELAVDEAQALGSLVVAASGNSGDEGNELSYPAVLPRVLTVGATNRDNRVASFSSFSPYVDVAAPGEAVQVAETVLDTTTNQPLRRWGESDGTSFASPLVAGAAAWIWTVRPGLTADQVAEVLRLSARDIDTPGRDPRSGFGIVDLSAALALPDPPRDAREPNDDIEYVSPDGDRNIASPPPLLAGGRTRGALSATIDRWEDPRDVYRVWAAARKSLTFTLTSSADNDLAVFKPGALSVTGRDSARDRLALGRTRGKVERLVFRNTGGGRWVYVAVTLPKGVDRATYRLAVTSSAAR
jgi:subtilisin family serine protease